MMYKEFSENEELVEKSHFAVDRGNVLRQQLAPSNTDNPLTQNIRTLIQYANDYCDMNMDITEDKWPVTLCILQAVTPDDMTLYLEGQRIPDCYLSAMTTNQHRFHITYDKRQRDNPGVSDSSRNLLPSYLVEDVLPKTENDKNRAMCYRVEGKTTSIKLGMFFAGEKEDGSAGAGGDDDEGGREKEKEREREKEKESTLVRQGKTLISVEGVKQFLASLVRFPFSSRTPPSPALRFEFYGNTTVMSSLVSSEVFQSAGQAVKHFRAQMACEEYEDEARHLGRYVSKLYIVTSLFR
jgi:hypothetical protein